MKCFSKRNTSAVLSVPVVALKFRYGFFVITVTHVDASSDPIKITSSRIFPYSALQTHMQVTHENLHMDAFCLKKCLLKRRIILILSLV